MRWKWMIVSALAALATGGVMVTYVIARTSHPAEAAAPPPAPIPVVAHRATGGDVPIYLRGVGTVIAYNNVVVRSQITGQLVKVPFRQGQTVKKGDLLGEIDPRPYQAQLDQAIANRDRDAAQVKNAQANLDRYTPLAKQGFATTQLVDTQRAQLAQLQAMVRSDDAVIAAARVSLGYTQLTSPIDGVTGIRQVDQGNIIHPTDANGLVDVTQIQPISIIFTLPETDFTDVQNALDKGSVTVMAYSQDDKTRLDEGRLVLINNQIIQTTGTIQLRADFPNAKRLLWPGELVDMRLLLTTRKNGITVPVPAVQLGPHGSYVYVVGSDGVAQMRPVKVGQISDGRALVDEGVNANETVVVAGQYRLEPGLHVRPLHGNAAREADLTSAVEQALP